MVQMLQKFYLKYGTQKTTLFYIETKNFNFDESHVFNKDLENIKIDGNIFKICTNMIIHNLHFPEETTYLGEDYDIAMGSLIKTPKELL